MVSTTPCSIQPSSLSTTGTASATIARSSILQLDWLETILPIIRIERLPTGSYCTELKTAYP